MKLSKDGLNKLDKNIEETKRKRAEVKKEVIIRNELLKTSSVSMTTLEGLKEENDEREEEIESELIRAGVIEEPKENEGKQVYQSLQDLFKPEKITTNLSVGDINESKGYSGLHKYDKNQGRYYKTDREIEKGQQLKDSSKKLVNFPKKKIEIEDLQDKRKKRDINNLSFNAQPIETETFVEGNFNPPTVKDNREIKESINFDRGKSLMEQINRNRNSE